MPLDLDVSPLDNSGSKKDGVSFAYKGYEGCAPMFAYLGDEGYGLDLELREAKQHSQNGTEAFLHSCIEQTQCILSSARLLCRNELCNDGADTIDVCAKLTVDFLIKRNLRHDSPAKWRTRAQQESEVVSQDPAQTVYRGSGALAPRAGHSPVRVVYEVTERTMTAKGQLLLIPEVEVKAFWTSLEGRRRESATASGIMQ